MEYVIIMSCYDNSVKIMNYFLIEFSQTSTIQSSNWTVYQTLYPIRSNVII